LNEDNNLSICDLRNGCFLQGAGIGTSDKFNTMSGIQISYKGDNMVDLRSKVEDDRGLLKKIDFSSLASEDIESVKTCGLRTVS